MKPWTIERIAEVLRLPIPASAGGPLRRIVTDSRKVAPGDVFVAITGDNFDGHDFIPKAIAAGASVVVSEKEGTHPSGTFFTVPSTLSALRALAHDHRRGFSIPIIAVVGAVGKTTTKELIASLLTGRFTRVHKTEGSQNGYLGIPMTLLDLSPDHEVAIIEIGIDEIGAMDQHVLLVEPTHLILTRTGPEHLHQLKSVEIAAEEELKAFDYGIRHQVNLALNLADPFVFAWHQNQSSKLSVHPHLTYSTDPGRTASLQGRFDSKASLLRVEGASGVESYPCPLPGAHHAENLLGALVVTSFLGLSPAEQKKGLLNFKTAFGRTEIHHLPEGIELIGDYYNSNPASLKAALHLLQSRAETRPTHAVLGDMLELGADEEAYHREVADWILDLKIGNVWLYGPRMRWLLEALKSKGHGACNHFETHEGLVKALKNQLKPGSHLLVKGSRGMRMEKILEGLHHPAGVS